MTTEPPPVVRRLVDATNGHDLDALVACFADEVVSEQPAHPARDFRGKDQLRANWQQILGGVPDLRIELLSVAVEGERVWCEWAFDGTRRDGVPFAMRGVTIFGIRDDRIASVHFYMEPVERAGVDVGDAVREAVAG
jgi:ketosteroid isomerase-like protein